MAFAECLESLVYYLIGQLCGSRAPAAFELEFQALLQVGGSHACRVEVLNDLQQFAQFPDRHVESHLEHQVVRYGRQGTLQVTVVVDVSDDVFGNLLVGLGQFPQVQLFEQVVVERGAPRDGNLFAGRIFAGNLSVYVRRSFVVVVVVAHEQVFGTFVARGVLFGRYVGFFFGRGVCIALIEGGIVDEFLLDLLFQLYLGQFEETYGLYLLRRQSLALLEFLFLFEHGSVLCGSIPQTKIAHFLRLRQ